MASFWDSWQLWEKMTFVLAIGIVVTILAGCLKLVHQHIQLKRYTKASEEQRVAEGSVIEKKGIRRGRNKPDIPFGVRAIESGVEVDGVWISRPNSIVTSPTGSPTPSSRDETRAKGGSPDQSPSHSPSLSPKPRSLSLPRATLSQILPQRSSPGATSTSQMQDDFCEHSRMNNAKEQSLKVPKSRDDRKYKPRRASQLRFSTENALEEESDSPYPRSSTDVTRADRSFSGSSTESERLGSRCQQFSTLNAQRPQSYSSGSTPKIGSDRGKIDMMPFTRHSTQDIEPLTMHGRSYAAENGQPSFRSRATSPDHQQYGPVTASRLGNDPVISTGKTSLRPSANVNEDRLNKATEVSKATRDIAISSHLDSLRIDSTDQSDTTIEGANTSSGSDEATTLQLGEPISPMRASQVIRKVNSGFEILQPGTFGPKTTAEPGQENRQFLDHGKRQPCKLHKKKTSTSSGPPENILATET